MALFLKIKFPNQRHLSIFLKNDFKLTHRFPSRSMHFFPLIFNQTLFMKEPKRFHITVYLVYFNHHKYEFRDLTVKMLNQTKKSEKEKSASVDIQKINRFPGKMIPFFCLLATQLMIFIFECFAGP